MAQLGESASEKRVMVLGVKDGFGRHLTWARIVVDADQLRPGYIATTASYLLPCEIVDGGDEGFTIDLRAELRIIGPPEAARGASRDDSDSRVWVNPETGGVESTVEWQRRLNAGDPEAHRQLAELCRRQHEAPPWPGPVFSHGVWLDVSGSSVVIRVADADGAMTSDAYVVFEEAMDVAELLGRAIARATFNSVEGNG